MRIVAAYSEDSVKKFATAVLRLGLIAGFLLGCLFMALLRIIA